MADPPAAGGPADAFETREAPTASQYTAKADVLEMLLDEGISLTEGPDLVTVQPGFANPRRFLAAHLAQLLEGSKVGGTERSSSWTTLTERRPHAAAFMLTGKGKLMQRSRFGWVPTNVTDIDWGEKGKVIYCELKPVASVPFGAPPTTVVYDVKESLPQEIGFVLEKGYAYGVPLQPYFLRGRIIGRSYSSFVREADAKAAGEDGLTCRACYLQATIQGGPVAGDRPWEFMHVALPSDRLTTIFGRQIVPYQPGTEKRGEFCEGGQVGNLERWVGILPEGEPVDAQWKWAKDEGELLSDVTWALVRSGNAASAASSGRRLLTLKNRNVPVPYFPSLTFPMRNGFTSFEGISLHLTGTLMDCVFLSLPQPAITALNSRVFPSALEVVLKSGVEGPDDGVRVRGIGPLPSQFPPSPALNIVSWAGGRYIQLTPGLTPRTVVRCSPMVEAFPFSTCCTHLGNLRMCGRRPYIYLSVEEMRSMTALSVEATPAMHSLAYAVYLTGAPISPVAIRDISRHGEIWGYGPKPPAGPREAITIPMGHTHPEPQIDHPAAEVYGPLFTQRFGGLGSLVKHPKLLAEAESLPDFRREILRYDQGTPGLIVIATPASGKSYWLDHHYAGFAFDTDSVAKDLPEAQDARARVIMARSEPYVNSSIRIILTNIQFPAATGRKVYLVSPPLDVFMTRIASRQAAGDAIAPELFLKWRTEAIEWARINRITVLSDFPDESALQRICGPVSQGPQ
jgi:hypothetical protein